MYKMRKQVHALICGIFFIGMTLQICLGIMWMLGNIGGFQQFGESYYLIEISKSFLCDEYTGILYPVLIMLARGVQKITSISYATILYVIQLFVACYSAHRFLNVIGVTSNIRTVRTSRQHCQSEKEIHKKWIRYASFWDIWGSLCLLTIPSAMQCHLAVLPNSLTLSMSLLLLSFGIEAVQVMSFTQKTQNNSESAVILPLRAQLRTASRTLEPSSPVLLKMLPFWLAASLLMPEYSLLLAVPMAYIYYKKLKYYWKYNYRRLLQNTVWLLMAIMVVIGASNLTQIPGSQGKMHSSVSATAVKRFVWPWFLENYSFWPEEIQNIMTVEQAREISWYPDYVTELFGPMVEDNMGERQAHRLYRAMVKIAINIHTKDIALALIHDTISYSVSPLMLGITLEGYGMTSFSGRNYEIMKNKLPGLTRDYVWYGNWWFSICLLLVGISLLIRSKESWKRTGKRLLLFLTCAGMVFYYTMSGAGIMDYKNTILVTLLWYCLIIKTCCGSGLKSWELEV